MWGRCLRSPANRPTLAIASKGDVTQGPDHVVRTRVKGHSQARRGCRHQASASALIARQSNANPDNLANHLERSRIAQIASVFGLF